MKIPKHLQNLARLEELDAELDEIEATIERARKQYPADLKLQHAMDKKEKECRAGRALIDTVRRQLVMRN